MYITDLLSFKSVKLKTDYTEKNEILQSLVNLLDTNEILVSKEIFLEDIQRREAISSTGIAEMIAIPHTRSKVVKKPAISAITTKNEIDFGAKDKKGSKLFFMIAVPEIEHTLHIEILGKLSLILLDKDFREQLMNCEDNEQFVKILSRAEALRFNEK